MKFVQTRIPMVAYSKALPLKEAGIVEHGMTKRRLRGPVPLQFTVRR